jgi:BASS family bile acid:Na+ symporter
MHRTTLMDVFRVLVLVAIPLAAFATGLRAAYADARWLLRHPGLLARALLAILIVLPVGAVIFLHTIAISPIVRAGLTIAIVSIGIGPPAAFGHVKMYVKAAVRDARTGPNESVAFEVGLNVVLLLLAIVYIPSVAAIHGAIFRHDLRLAPQAVAKVVLGRALMPLALGVAVGRFVPRAIAPIARWAGVFVQAVLVIVLAVALVATWHGLVGLGGRAWLTCLAIVLVEVAVGHLAGGPSPETRRVLASFSAMRFPALALLIAHLVPNEREIIPVIIAYVLSSFVVITLHGALTTPGPRGAARPRPGPVEPRVGVGVPDRYGAT